MIKKTHILALSEIQIRTEDIDNINIEDYKLEIDSLHKSKSKSHSGILIHKDIIYERKSEYETQRTVLVVIKVGLKNQQKYCLCNIIDSGKCLTVSN